MEALGAAVVCTILAKAGPQRSRILANLYKDERTAALPTFSFMQKVYLERVLRPDEVPPRPPPNTHTPMQQSVTFALPFHGEQGEQESEVKIAAVHLDEMNGSG